MEFVKQGSLVNDNQRNFIYTGNSMYPTLRQGDLIVLEAGRKRPIRRGDVIVFSRPGEKRHIVHRVEAAVGGGFLTRGDGSGAMDDGIVKPEQVRGRVDHIVREKRFMRVPRGPSRTALRFRLTLDGIDRKARHQLGSLYQGFARKVMPRRWLFPLLRPKLLCLRRPDGLEWKLFSGQRQIGFLPPGAVSWRIRRPYLLMIDESALPCAGINRSAGPIR